MFWRLMDYLNKHEDKILFWIVFSGWIVMAGWVLCLTPEYSTAGWCN